MFRIGITSSIMYNDPDRVIYNGRSLLYVERSMLEYFDREDFLTYVLAVPPERFREYLEKTIPDLDGLVLSGGGDVEPNRYGEKPLREDWVGDALRDAYEFEAVKIAFRHDIPILGICRGHQVLNVAFGGSLFQDISHQNEGAFEHRDASVYEKNKHDVYFPPGSALREIYASEHGRINSIHHQGIKGLADGFDVEARSKEDQIIESILWKGKEFIRGVQWHPEFQSSDDGELLSSEPLIEEFREAMKERRKFQKRKRVKRLLIDFDGVIHRYNSGWIEANIIPDPPVVDSDTEKDAIEWLRTLLDSEEFAIHIYSRRGTDPKDGGIPAMREWLGEHGLEESYMEKLIFQSGKPESYLLIDDRCWQFDGHFPTSETLVAFKPWWVGENGPSFK